MVALTALALAADTADTGDGCVPTTCASPAILASTDTCEAGHPVRLGATGCEGGTYTWQSDEDESFAAEGPSIYFTCPEVACPSERIVVYLVASDACEDQQWAQLTLDVACVPPSEDPCGCASPTPPGTLLTLVALALARRSRP